MNKKEILEFCLNSGFQVNPNTLDYIQNQNDPRKFLSEMLKKFSLKGKIPLVISIEAIESLDKEKLEEKQVEKLDDKKKIVIEEKSPPKLTPEPIKIKEKPLEEKIDLDLNAFNVNHEPNIEIHQDPTGALIGTGTVDDFILYFRNRYDKLKKILMKQHRDVRPISVQAAKKSIDEFIYIIVMIRDLTKTNSGNYILELEDETDSIQAYIYQNKEELYKETTHLMLDQVIGIKGIIKQSKEDKSLIINEIVWPNVPLKRKRKLASVPIFAALLSDTHFGSKNFQKDKFKKFLQWLRGDVTDPRNKYISQKLKYIIIAGDVVDGIGVYPSQYDDLEIKDIYKQYEYAAKWISHIPKHINIIMIPGGAHDAIRKAMPQPAIDKKFARSLYKLKNVIMLGNPAFITLENVKFLLTHGDSFDDLITSIPHLSYEKSTEAMVEMLRCRHISPIYGLKTGIAPEREDHLVIDDVPDVFHAGHTHVLDIKTYRNTMLVNSGCFQSQTSFMKEKGIFPTVAKVPVINLQTLEATVIDFNEE